MNYFNYFTEIEERFQQRRGSLLMLSTLDWALIETWREAGIPLEAVLCGIDAAFDKHDAQAQRGTRRPRKVNGLAWCAQAVLEAVEQSRDAAIGSAPSQPAESRESGFEEDRIARYLERNAALLAAAADLPSPANTAASEAASRLRELAATYPLLSSRNNAEGSASPSNLEPAPLNLEALDRTLTVLEEKLFAALLTAAPEDQLVSLREQAARELAPYRGKMQSVQIKQVQQQFLQKRLLEAYSLPRLSLFYMPHEDQV
ncbi:MAG: hypothetical protein P4K80_01020 [Acidobacteriaceae bacterium]|nr:hypothetical protein [Acidobacteriaceae bacterium]